VIEKAEGPVTLTGIWFNDGSESEIFLETMQGSLKRNSQMTTIDRSRTNSVQNSVYVTLRNSIINLNLAPGTTISEKEIALRFNISRTPVREAFIHLSKEGLVKVYPQKETQVSPIDFVRVKQELFLRASLENAVVEFFLQNCGSGDYKTLEELITKQTAAVKTKSYTEFLDHDNSFHHLFFEVGGQVLSWEVLDRMSGHYHRARLLSIWLTGAGNDLVRDHQKIYNALKKQDLETARKLLYLHIYKLDAEEEILRGKFPGYFTSGEEKNTFDVDFGGFPLPSG
jgi:DNA-binding GntR family transcriptional regulator